MSPEKLRFLNRSDAPTLGLVALSLPWSLIQFEYNNFRGRKLFTFDLFETPYNIAGTFFPTSGFDPKLEPDLNPKLTISAGFLVTNGGGRPPV